MDDKRYGILCLIYEYDSSSLSLRVSIYDLAIALNLLWFLKPIGTCTSPVHSAITSTYVSMETNQAERLTEGVMTENSLFLRRI